MVTVALIMIVSTLINVIIPTSFHWLAFILLGVPVGIIGIAIDMAIVFSEYK